MTSAKQKLPTIKAFEKMIKIMDKQKRPKFIEYYDIKEGEFKKIINEQSSK